MYERFNQEVWSKRADRVNKLQPMTLSSEEKQVVWDLVNQLMSEEECNGSDALADTFWKLLDWLESTPSVTWEQVGNMFSLLREEE